MEAKKHVAGAEPNYLFEHYQEDGNWGLQRTLPEPKLLLLSSQILSVGCSALLPQPVPDQKL